MKALNASIKEKTDTIPPHHGKHIQIGLIDFHEFSEQNNGFAWLLSCVCIFSKFLFAIPMKNKEATTVATHLIKDVFKNFGPPETLQSEIISQVCNILQTPHHNTNEKQESNNCCIAADVTVCFMPNTYKQSFILYYCIVLSFTHSQIYSNVRCSMLLLLYVYDGR